VDHPADFCFRLPEQLSAEEGAMVEPLSVGVHAARRGQVSPGKTVAILGAGPIGARSSPFTPCPATQHPGHVMEVVWRVPAGHERLSSCI
jgi:hypothetical protein